MPITATELYEDLWVNDGDLIDEVGRSLDPRPSSVLYDRFAELGIGAGTVVLDAGCGYGDHSIRLVERFGRRVIAVDPMSVHLAAVREKVAGHPQGALVDVREGTVEHLPLADASVDHVWCRDVMSVVPLEPALLEFARVLLPGGALLVYQTFATELLEAQEAARLFAAMAIRPRNMDPAAFEAAAVASGFTVELRDPIDSEWRERWIEQGDIDVAQDLLRLARMRRDEDRLVARFGRAKYEAVYANYQWGAYQLLGKLCPTAYLLRKA